MKAHHLIGQKQNQQSHDVHLYSPVHESAKYDSEIKKMPLPMRRHTYIQAYFKCRDVYLCLFCFEICHIIQGAISNEAIASVERRDFIG